MKNTMATGIVMRRAAAIFSGNCEPPPSCPLTRVATPEVSVFSSGLCLEMMKCGSSFQEARNDRMVSVMTAGLAIGSTTDQKVRNAPAPSNRADSSTSTGMLMKNCRMMKTPAVSAISGMIMPR